MLLLDSNQIVIKKCLDKTALKIIQTKPSGRDTKDKLQYVNKRSLY